MCAHEKINIRFVKILINERQVWGKLATLSAHKKGCVLVSEKLSHSVFTKVSRISYLQSVHACQTC